MSFLVIAIIAAVQSFGGIAGAASGVAQILFIVFLILAAVSIFRNIIYCNDLYSLSDIRQFDFSFVGSSTSLMGPLMQNQCSVYSA